MNITHVKLRHPQGMEMILASIDSPFTPEVGDFVRGVEMGHVDQVVSGIVEEVYELEDI